jgi:hypothetical protein
VLGIQGSAVSAQENQKAADAASFSDLPLLVSL